MSVLHIISCSVRPENETRKVAEVYKQICIQQSIPFHFVDLAEVPHDIIKAAFAGDKSVAPEFSQYFEQNLAEIQFALWVLPEYNGSLPGILKLVIDCSDVRKAFQNTQNCMTGVASGRAGNLRGLDHLTAILNHMQASVYWDKLPISQVHTFIQSKKFTHEETIHRMEQQLSAFLRDTAFSM